MSFKLTVLTFIAFLLLSINGYGQSKEIQGKISNTKDVEGIHVLNKTSRYNAITDQEGGFNINVRKQDTLYFSSINYKTKIVIITEEIYTKEYVVLTLEQLINELEEVVIGPNLTGNLATDIKNIKTETPVNFDDVGIPGFKGKPEEKIAPGYTLRAPSAVNVEALYNHLSGYYKKLRMQRKWESQNYSVAGIINLYGFSFFEEAYKIPNNRLYDFLLYCMETSTLDKDFKSQNYASLLSIFEEKSETYLIRLSKKKE
ncbi:hypothetical protein ABXT64_02690 [Candidatus Marifrigoribacter sp. Uisw_064]|jgi:hypothetical protein|uniref:hypothetical protein n=1 Tax=Candidatus Marifrigoribacter sp. Uisw_064 TaxID=3230970 RepID=UPI003AE4745A